MTDPLAKPVEVWAVVDKDGNIDLGYLCDTEDQGKQLVFNIEAYRVDKTGTPYRVARVKIEEVKER